MHDAINLLRDIKPGGRDFDPDSPSAVAALKRIVSSPAPSQPPRRGRRRPVIALAAAVVAAGAVAVPALVGSSPDVIARASDALDTDGGILHVATRERHPHSGKRLDEDDPSTFYDRTFEMWQTDGRRQERYIYDNGEFESVRDIDTKTSLGYVRDRDELIRHTNPDLFKPDGLPQHLDGDFVIQGSEVRDIDRMLRRARDGDDRVRLTGEATVRGVPVHVLRIDHEVNVYDGPDPTQPMGIASHKEMASRLVYIDRETYLPVRFVERGPREVVTKIVDFFKVENLPRTPENERLLEMSPHPGAKEVVRD